MINNRKTTRKTKSTDIEEALKVIDDQAMVSAGSIAVVLLIIYIAITWGNWSDILRALLPNLISATILFFTSYFFLRRQRKIRQEVYDSKFVSSVSAEVIRKLNHKDTVSQNGIIAVYPRFPTDEIQKAAKEATTRVMILTSWLYRDDQLSCLEDVHQTIPVRLLLVKPNSEYVKKRTERLKPRLVVKVDDVKYLKSFLSGLNLMVQARYYDEAAPFQLYVFDNRAFLSFYWYDTNAGFRTFLEIHLDNGANKTTFDYLVVQEFNNIWNYNTSEDIPL